jgi:hypothetical protein
MKEVGSWVVIAGLALSVNALAEGDDEQAKPDEAPKVIAKPPEPQPAPKLGTMGESCRTNDDCEAELPCLEHVCGKKVDATIGRSPVDRYREFSVSITSGMNLSLTSASNVVLFANTSAFVGTSIQPEIALGVNARVVDNGIMFGLEFGVAYQSQTVVNLETSATATQTSLLPGFSLGYVIPISDRLAFTPSFHATFDIDIVGEEGSSETLSFAQLSGELALEVFLGAHAFFEPLISAGDLQLLNSGGSGIFVFGFGYRLGIVF